MWICKKKLSWKAQQFTIVLFLIAVLMMIAYVTLTVVVFITPAKPEEISLEIPSYVADSVKVFVLFIGHTHSSHSIVASVLDSHPHMIVSHESGIIPALIDTPSSTNKSNVYNRIWTSSYKSSVVEGGNRLNNVKGYNLVIDKEWQGRYNSYVDVMGDDEAHVIPIRWYFHREKVQAMLKRLPSLVGVPTKLFHVIRNPYDNIATEVLYRNFKHDRHKVSNAKSSTERVTVDSEVVDASIRYYFRLHEGVEFVKKEYDTMTIHIRDFISHPKSVITNMCEFLGVVCSEDYIDKCSEKIFNKESKTRYKITWNSEQVANIHSSIQKFNSLKRYEEFDS